MHKSACLQLEAGNERGLENHLPVCYTQQRTYKYIQHTSRPIVQISMLTSVTHPLIFSCLKKPLCPPSSSHVP